MIKPIKDKEGYIPKKGLRGVTKHLDKVYFCKNCATEICLPEHKANGGYCHECFEDVYEDFGEEGTNGTY